MKKEKYIVTGMTCSACSARVERAVNKLTGIESVAVNLLTNSMQVEYDEAVINSDGIIAAVVEAGYGASFTDNARKNKQKDTNGSNQVDKYSLEIAEMKTRLCWSAAFLLLIIYISMHNIMEMAGIVTPEIVKIIFDGTENAITFALAQFILLLPILLLNKKYFINGFKNLYHAAPNMDSLVGLGSAASALFGIFAIFRMSYGLGHGDIAVVEEYRQNLYFESAGMIVTLITMGKYLEAKAKGSTTEALKKLMSLSPKTAKIIKNGNEVEVNIEDLAVDDIIVVRPGETIPADGIITMGNTSIDEAAITGESMPVEKKTGDKVISGTINKSGFINFSAKRVGEDSTINQIIRLVDEASSSKAPIAKLADKIAGVFVPVVISIAVITGAIWLYMGASIEFAFSISISILVISCPCALGLATPVAIMVGTGKGAEHGILIKSGKALEIAHSIDTVVMDKTGTITSGKPVITDIIGINAKTERLLQIAVSLEKGSEHPLAEAINSYGEAQFIKCKKVDNFEAIFGRGVRGKINNRVYFAGNKDFLKENDIYIDEQQVRNLDELSDQGKTPLLFADEKRLLGIIAVADVEKESSKKAIKDFQAMGIDVVMLTGDNKRTAKAVSKRLGLTHCIAEVMPEDKLSNVETLQKQGRKVAMIGDGINDAPALIKADLGIAIGAGTDIAMESADAVLVKSNLLDAVSAISLSKAVIKNIKENLFWAFFYNIICIPLAAGALYPVFGIKLSPMIGAAAMSMSSVCVVLNALRLKLKSFNDMDIIEKNSGKVYNNYCDDINMNVEKHSIINIVEAEMNILADMSEGREEDVTMQTELKIEGMMCKHCQKHVHDALAAMSGVTNVEVDLAAGKAFVTSDVKIDMNVFEKVIVDAGYELIK